jgi:hypothetical protein
MKNRKYIKQLFIALVVLGLCSTVLFSCKKNDYFKNPSGVSKAKYDGTIMDYLRDNHVYFDTLSAIIDYAGMTDIFTNDSITFFAPPDSTINLEIENLNYYLRYSGMQEITSFKQVSPETWKHFLERYIFKGVKRLEDFPQIDLDNLLAFPGQYYRAYDSTLMNIGVVYSDLESGGNTIKYGGYRYLMISFIPSEAAPTVGRSYSEVASSDINPYNGIVHVLSILGFGDYPYSHYFGFSPSEFINSALKDGIIYN